MSNENTVLNRPRIKSGNSSSRYRKFSCITYLNNEQLEKCLSEHANQIRVYAYACHDKDKREDGTLKEPHFHLIIVCFNACTVSAVRRWFSGYVDKNGDITTTAQKCTDVFQMYDYLTHSTPEAMAAGKYQYDKSIIVTNDEDGYFKALETSGYDNIILATEMLLKGKPVREVGKIFGRDFILHYSAIKQYVNDVLMKEKYGMSLENVLDYEFEKEIRMLNGDL